MLLSILLRLDFFHVVLAVRVVILLALWTAVLPYCFPDCAQLHDRLRLWPVVTTRSLIWTPLETVFPLCVALRHPFRWTARHNHFLGFFKFVVDDQAAYVSIILTVQSVDEDVLECAWVAFLEF